jgi:hypothetical protein
MKALEGRGLQLLFILNLDNRRGEWSASRHGRDFSPGERIPGTHKTGGWVGPTLSSPHHHLHFLTCPAKISLVQPIPVFPAELLCSLLTHRPKNGGSVHLWNVRLLQRDYVILSSRKLSLSKLQTFKILHRCVNLHAPSAFIRREWVCGVNWMKINQRSWKPHAVNHKFTRTMCLDRWGKTGMESVWAAVLVMALNAKHVCSILTGVVGRSQKQVMKLRSLRNISL